MLVKLGLVFLRFFSFFFVLRLSILSNIDMIKVTVCGAAGGIGQPLSLFLKQSNFISHLALYDIMNAHGVATDLR